MTNCKQWITTETLSNMGQKSGKFALSRFSLMLPKENIKQSAYFNATLIIIILERFKMLKS
jgi:hypothetical protein